LLDTLKVDETTGLKKSKMARLNLDIEGRSLLYDYPIYSILKYRKERRRHNNVQSYHTRDLWVVLILNSQELYYLPILREIIRQLIIILSNIEDINQS